MSTFKYLHLESQGFARALPVSSVNVPTFQTNFPNKSYILLVTAATVSQISYLVCHRQKRLYLLHGIWILEKQSGRTFIE